MREVNDVLDKGNEWHTRRGMQMAHFRVMGYLSSLSMVFRRAMYSLSCFCLGQGMMSSRIL